MITPEALSSLVNALAVVISQDRTADEINTMAVLLVQLGDTLATIATLRGAGEE